MTFDPQAMQNKVDEILADIRAGKYFGPEALRRAYLAGFEARPEEGTRDAALEEAAQIAEKHRGNWTQTEPLITNIAFHIRALKRRDMNKE